MKIVRLAYIINLISLNNNVESKLHPNKVLTNGNKYLNPLIKIYFLFQMFKCVKLALQFEFNFISFLYYDFIIFIKHKIKTSLRNHF